MLNEALNVVNALDFERQGEVVMLKEVLDDGERALVIAHTDEERVVHARRAAACASRCAPATRCCSRPGPATSTSASPRPRSRSSSSRRSPTSPTPTSAASARRSSRSATPSSCRYLHADLFREHQLRPPKGVLLYGPPGCGKTLIAKAVANSLAKKVAAKAGQGEAPTEAKSFFLNIKGPELLNKYVGETERHIRLVFQRAREKATEGMPVIVFFDEMDSIFRTRGSGVSTDVENTIVPQLLSRDRRRRGPGERHRHRRLATART